MDQATQKHAQLFYLSRKTIDRNIEIVKQLLDGKSREDVAVAFSLSKTQITWIADKMMRNMGHHIRWLGIEHPWPLEKFPNAHCYLSAAKEHSFVASYLTIEQLRLEKDFVLKILFSLRELLLAYCEWQATMLQK